MAKLAGVFFFLFVLFQAAFGADISYDLKSDRIEFVLNFAKGYSNLNVLKSDKGIVFSFETSEKIEFARQDFFDLPLTSAYLISESFRKKFVVSFEQSVIEPVVSKEAKKITLTFPFSVPINQGGNQPADMLPNTKTPAVPGAGAYFRMIFGLCIVLFLVLLGYWFVKSYLKKKVFTDIPGSGRLLGKVDLDIRKSLFFYEIGDNLYIIGASDGGLGLIDKISDEAEAAKIRAGFTKKREFTGYMSFFKRKNELDDEISTSNALVEEKLKSLRKK